jgi:hypothetical protein
MSKVTGQLTDAVFEEDELLVVVDVVEVVELVVVVL